MVIEPTTDDARWRHLFYCLVLFTAKFIIIMSETRYTPINNFIWLALRKNRILPKNVSITHFVCIRNNNRYKFNLKMSISLVDSGHDTVFISEERRLLYIGIFVRQRPWPSLCFRQSTILVDKFESQIWKWRHGEIGICLTERYYHIVHGLVI